MISTPRRRTSRRRRCRSRFGQKDRDRRSDNTLWGGEVGDIGWENLRVGGHDSIGEAYVDFQRVLKRLTERGILLPSKNEESVALAGIEKHPEMILRLDDFVGWRINWKDKAQNIAEMLTSLNLESIPLCFSTTHLSSDPGSERPFPRCLFPNSLRIRSI